MLMIAEPSAELFFCSRFCAKCFTCILFISFNYCVEVSTAVQMREDRPVGLYSILQVT